MIRSIYKIQLFLAVLFFSCKTTKIYSPKLEDLKNRVAIRIPLKELIQNKSIYHGKIVETEGALVYGFEDFSIHYYDEFHLSDTITTRQENISGLGIELHPNLHLEQKYLISLRGQIIKVKGVFDSTDFNKVSGMPESAVLKNVFYFQPTIK